jgi:hypothetical protein
MIPLFARRTGVFAAPVLVIACISLDVIVARGAAAQAPDDDATLRSRVEARFEVVPLSRGIGLRPRDRAARIRLIEITDGTIAIDGTPVSGSALREQIGTDADLVFRLSYLDPPRLRALFAPPAPPPPPPQPPPVQVSPEAPPPEPPGKPEPPPDRGPEPRRRVGDRVRVFGNVTVARDEDVRGQAVAVLGSVRVDGHVSDQVVAVMGSVDLGPDARVGGDVIAVGGRVRQADGAEIRGSVTEVALFAPGVLDGRGVPWWIAPGLLHPFTGAARLVGTLFRLVVLGLLASIIVLVARQPVERIGRRVSSEPMKMAAIGLLAQLLLFPALFFTSVILAISIIGIPLLLLIPVALLAVLIVLIGGFTGAAQAVGGWVAARAGLNAEQPFIRAWLGVLILLAPLLMARLFGLVGGPFSVLPLILAALAITAEYVVWTTGFGAALATAYDGWHRRTPAASVVVPALPPDSA